MLTNPLVHGNAKKRIESDTSDLVGDRAPATGIGHCDDSYSVVNTAPGLAVASGGDASSSTARPNSGPPHTTLDDEDDLFEQFGMEEDI